MTYETEEQIKKKLDTAVYGHSASDFDNPSYLEGVPDEMFHYSFSSWNNRTNRSFVYQYLSYGCFNVLEELLHRGINISRMSSLSRKTVDTGGRIYHTEYALASIACHIKYRPGAVFFLEEHLSPMPVSTLFGRTMKQGVDRLSYGDGNHWHYFSNRDNPPGDSQLWQTLSRVGQCFREDAATMRLLKQTLVDTYRSLGVEFTETPESLAALQNTVPNLERESMKQLAYLHLYIGAYYDVVTRLTTRSTSRQNYYYYSQRAALHYDAAVLMLNGLQMDAIQEITTSLNLRKKRFIAQQQIFLTAELGHQHIADNPQPPTGNVKEKSEVPLHEQLITFWEERLQEEKEQVLTPLMEQARDLLGIEHEVAVEEVPPSNPLASFFGCLAQPEATLPARLYLHPSQQISVGLGDGGETTPLVQRSTY